jgi:hypothetical protein
VPVYSLLPAVEETAVVGVELPWPVHVVGLGAVGSFTLLFLAKLGVAEIHGYDPDVVEERNLGGQLYGPDDVGQPKATAAAARIASLTGLWPQTYRLRVAQQVFAGVVVLAVDTMAARQEIYRSSLRGRARIPWVVDVRVGSSPRLQPVGFLCTFAPFEEASSAGYEHLLYADGESIPPPCGTGLPAHVAAHTAAQVVARLVRLARGERGALLERLAL